MFFGVEKLRREDLQRYLLLLHQLVPQLQAPREKRRYEEDEDSDEEDNRMDVDEHVSFYYCLLIHVLITSVRSLSPLLLLV